MQRLMIVLLASAAIDPAHAQQDGGGAALVQVFNQFCLANFPEPRRIETAGQGQLTQLPPAGVQRYLHEDPGRGWIYRSDGAEYVVTVEDPPYHTCAVRRSFATPPKYLAPYTQVISAWAKAGGLGSFVDLPAQVIRREDLIIEGATHVAQNGHGDVLMDIRTTYPNGQVEQRLARRAMRPGDRP